jgi:hypothetical protein
VIISPLIAETRSTDLEMARSAVGIIIVVTVLEVLFPVFVSNTLHVIVAKFDNIHHVALTVQVIVTLPTHQLNRLHIFKVNTFPETLPVDVVNPVNHDGRVSLITIHVAVFGQALA